MAFESKCNEQHISTFKATIGPNNEGNEIDNTSNEQDDQGQGDQGEHEQQYGEEVIATYFFNIHTLVHQLGASYFNLNLNIAQCYYVDMFDNPPMTKDGVKENLVINIDNLGQEQI